MAIEQSIGYVICTTARKIHQHLTEQFKTYNITPEQWVVLKSLSLQDGISQKEIADIVDKDPNNIKALVDKLEAKSLLERKQNPLDKRAFSLHVTIKGEKLVQQLSSLDETMLDTIHNDLRKKDITRLYDTLHQIQKNINKAK